jgi:GNAT superfamily N-acetyltransferase
VAILIRSGGVADIDAATSVFERSNLARRGGEWPDRAARVERVRRHLRDRASWFLLASDGPEVVGMAAAEPLRGADGTGPVVPGGCFLSFLFVVPERWGEGIGGVLLDDLLAGAERRSCTRVHLWTDDDNARSQRLYRSRGFAPTGRTANGASEWMCHLPPMATT